MCIRDRSHSDFALFELELIPNYEFYSKIMMSAHDLEVISPQYVRSEIADRLKAASDMYPKLMKRTSLNLKGAELQHTPSHKATASQE